METMRQDCAILSHQLCGGLERDRGRRYYLRITNYHNYQLLELPTQLVGIPN